MRKPPERLIPLVELPPEQDPVQVALLIRSARNAPDEDTSAVTWRIRDTLHRRFERRARLLRFAVVGAVIFVVGAAVGAVVQPLLRTPVPSPTTPGVAPAPPPLHHGRRRPPRPSAPEVPLPAPPEASPEPESPQPEGPPPAAAAPAPALPALATRNKPKPAPLRLAASQPSLKPEPTPPAPPVATTPAPLATEQALVSSALTKLRVFHEPAAALALLDEHRARFPRGVLATEAARLRTEALLLLGRKAAVLDELDRAPALDADSDALVLRGELRAAAGRWQAALADFDAVVRAQSGGAPLNDGRVRDRFERALWGRASAHSHLGQDDAVCADLGEYFRRFPRGRFAAQAKHLLDKECEP